VVKTSFSYKEAKETLLRHVPSTGSERVPLVDAVGRILAENIDAQEDFPSFDRASMDGFAVHIGERVVGEQERIVIGEVQAGSVFGGRLDARSAVRIMTGASVPAGANAVVEIERVREDGKALRFDPDVRPGRNIRLHGEELHRGDRAFSKGACLSAPHIGLLATMGYATVAVARRPKIAVLVTGTELLSIDAAGEPGKIRESNSWMLRAAASVLGLPVLSVSAIPDDPRQIAHELERALAADAVLLSGGVSVGKYDYVLEAFRRVGVELVFWKIRMKPGMPFAFGLSRAGSRTVPVFALPGNPVSTYVTFRLMVQPALEAMQGKLDARTIPSVQAMLASPIAKTDDKRHFVRGTLRPDMSVEPFATQSSGVLSSLAASNCLIVLPEDARDCRAGLSVEVILI
jgi:molybdopterin molybdotransferase